MPTTPITFTAVNVTDTAHNANAMETNQISEREFVAGLRLNSLALLPDSESDTDCAICYGPYESKEQPAPENPVLVPCCGKTFHRGCIVQWVSEYYMITCPNCRTVLFTMVQDSEVNDDSDENDDSEGITDGDSEEHDYDDHDEGPDHESIYEYNTAVIEGEEWEPEIVGDNSEEVPDTHEEDIIRRLHQRYHQGLPPLGSRGEYRQLLEDGAYMPPLEVGEPTLDLDQELALFRELQQRGAFELQDMKEMYWEERGWRHFRTYEHLRSKNTLWDYEAQRWFRAPMGEFGRYVSFYVPRGWELA